MIVNNPKTYKQKKHNLGQVFFCGERGTHTKILNSIK